MYTKVTQYFTDDDSAVGYSHVLTQPTESFCGTSFNYEHIYSSSLSNGKWRDCLYGPYTFCSGSTSGSACESGNCGSFYLDTAAITIDYTGHVGDDQSNITLYTGSRLYLSSSLELAPDAYYVSGGIYYKVGNGDCCGWNDGTFISSGSCPTEPPPTVGYKYNITGYSCNTCNSTITSQIVNSTPLTVDKYYYLSLGFEGPILITGYVGEVPLVQVNTYILDSSKKATCAEVSCIPASFIMTNCGECTDILQFNITNPDTTGGLTLNTTTGSFPSAPTVPYNYISGTLAPTALSPLPGTFTINFPGITEDCFGDVTLYITDSNGDIQSSVLPADGPLTFTNVYINNTTPLLIEAGDCTPCVNISVELYSDTSGGNNIYGVTVLTDTYLDYNLVVEGYIREAGDGNSSNWANFSLTIPAGLGSSPQSGYILILGPASNAEVIDVLYGSCNVLVSGVNRTICQC